MNLRKMFITAVVIVFAFTAVALSWSIYRALNPQPYYYAIDSSEPLTEALAVEFTRKALVDDSKASIEMRPIPYWPDSQYDNPEEAERLFARNSIDPSNGYVIWSIGYHVRIERSGDVVECRVYSPK
jgi:hypothetical protein